KTSGQWAKQRAWRKQASRSTATRMEPVLPPAADERGHRDNKLTEYLLMMWRQLGAHLASRRPQGSGGEGGGWGGSRVVDGCREKVCLLAGGVPPGQRRHRTRRRRQGARQLLRALRSLVRDRCPGGGEQGGTYPGRPPAPCLPRVSLLQGGGRGPPA